MPDLKISAAADPGALVSTDKVPVARSASTTAYAATMAELAAFANTAYVPNYFAGTPSMDGTGAAGTAAFVSRGDHVHPTDTTRAPLASPTFTGTPAAPTATTGTNTTQLATTAFVQSQMVASGAGVSTWNTRAGAVVLQQSDITAVGALHDVGRNLLHNPLFNVAQRGAGPWTTSASYTLDRWQLILSGDTASVTQQPATDGLRAAIGDESWRYFLSNSFTGSATSSAFNELVHKIEGVRRLAGKTVTLSFWAWSGGSLSLGLSGYMFYGTGGSPSAPDAFSGIAPIALTVSPARYSRTFTLPSSAGRTLGTNGDDYTTLQFWCSTASVQAPTSGIGVQSGAINLWGVQLEIGSIATPLEKPDPQYDLANCQRFYQVGPFGWNGNTAAGALIGGVQAFPVTMRATPTMVLSSPSYTNASAATANAFWPSGVQITATGTAAGTASFATLWFASADL